MKKIITIAIVALCAAQAASAFQQTRCVRNYDGSVTCTTY